VKDKKINTIFQSLDARTILWFPSLALAVLNSPPKICAPQILQTIAINSQQLGFTYCKATRKNACQDIWVFTIQEKRAIIAVLEGFLFC
jgi:hypothetical protein